VSIAGTSIVVPIARARLHADPAPVVRLTVSAPPPPLRLQHVGGSTVQPQRCIAGGR